MRLVALLAVLALVVVVVLLVLDVDRPPRDPELDGLSRRDQRRVQQLRGELAVLQAKNRLNAAELAAQDRILAELDTTLRQINPDK